MLILPFVFLVQDRQAGESFGFAFSAGFLSTLPLITLDLLQYSQQWQASDIFRVAPMNGPAELSAGARRAVICVLAVPAFILVAFIFWVIQRDASHLLLMLPGMLLLPVVALVPALMQRGGPFCLPNEEAKSAGRGLKMLLVMVPGGAALLPLLARIRRGVVHLVYPRRSFDRGSALFRPARDSLQTPLAPDRIVPSIIPYPWCFSTTRSMRRSGTNHIRATRINIPTEIHGLANARGIATR